MVEVVKLNVVRGDQQFNRTMRNDREALGYLIGMIETLYSDIKIEITRVEEEHPIYSVDLRD